MFAFLALALFVFSLRYVSFAKAALFVNSYASTHGALGRHLTEEDYRPFSDRLPIAAAFFGICGITLALSKDKLADFLLEVPSEWPQFRNFLLGQFQGRTETALEIGAVFSVFVTGVFLRAWHLGRTIRFDEAWTYVEFASRPLVLALSNYRRPNNQLLNTLLVHFSTKVFGNTLFGLRLPALIAGCLVVVVSWFVARSLYGRIAGILTAGCIASFPPFIAFSVNARGYALQWLCILGLIWFAVLLRENPALRIAWLGLILSGVAGIYTIPTTLLAIAGVLVWLFVSTLADGDTGELKNLFGKMLFAGFAIGMLSALLYTPPLLVRGAIRFADEIVVGGIPIHIDFAQGLHNLRECTWMFWTDGVPATILWILFGGLAIGLVFHRRVCKYRVPITIVLCALAALFVWADHVFAYARVWSYLLLSAMMIASAGLSFLLVSLMGRSQLRQVLAAGIVSLGLTLAVGAAVIRQRVLFTSTETGFISDVDQIVDYLSANLHSGDRLLGNLEFSYELLRRNPRLSNSLANPGEGTHVVAVVFKSTPLPLKSEICKAEEIVPFLAAQDIASPASLARELDLTAYTPPRVEAKFLTATVYSLDRLEGVGNREANPQPQPQP